MELDFINKHKFLIEEGNFEAICHIIPPEIHNRLPLCLAYLKVADVTIEAIQDRPEWGTVEIKVNGISVGIYLNVSVEFYKDTQGILNFLEDKYRRVMELPEEVISYLLSNSTVTITSIV